MDLRRTRPFLLLALLAALLLAPAGAQAAVTVKKSMWGPTTINGQSAFPTYADLGAGIYQMTLQWSQVAPTKPKHATDPEDPAYKWPADVDYAIGEGAKYGIRVALMVIYTPPWANGKKKPRWAPTKAQDYADFMTAASKRYKKVRYWMVWGEPTRQDNFMPNPKAAQAQAPVKHPSKTLTRGARKYAELVDDSYSALKRVRRSNQVIGGMSFITGDVGPYNWTRFVKLPNGKPPRMDMWGHNPFGAREPDLKRTEVGPGLADFSDLDDLAKWLDRYQKRGSKKLKIFLSEYMIPTDKPNYEFNFYATREAQARFLTSALKIVRGWSRIYTLGYFSLLDDPPNGKGDEVLRGLIDQQGNKKPGYFAFKDG
jgi:hypothetical protein